MLFSRFSVLIMRVGSFIFGGWSDYFYKAFLISLLFCFLVIRMPHVYGFGWFVGYISFVIWSLFISLLICRLVDLDGFFSGFVPPETPLLIAPFVCLVEGLSYILRPVVLVIRPFVNLTLGVAGGQALGLMCLTNYWLGAFFFFLFFYEVFVALVHWFIVCEILSFSESH